MKTLRVGQRVRILWSINWPELAGETGRILAWVPPQDRSDPACEWEVHVDAWGGSQAPASDPELDVWRFCPSSGQLETITPSGHCAGEYSFANLMLIYRINPNRRQRVKREPATPAHTSDVEARP